MLCENCKANNATTHIKKTVNGITKEYYLCQKCANELGLNSINFFDSNEFFNILLGNKVVHSKEQKICKKCNSTYKQIVKSDASASLFCCYLVFVMVKYTMK